MRLFIFFILIGTFYLSTSLAVADNKVVVIPLISAMKLNNIVTVSSQGGDFTDPVEAVNSIITKASADNPYLVVIGPGVYTLSNALYMRPYVTIAGSGQHATKLIGGISTGVSYGSGIVRGASNAVLRDLTIEYNGDGGSQSRALFNSYSSPIIENVSIIASGGSSTNYGVLNSHSSPTMMNVIVTVSSEGTSESLGVFNNNSSSPTMTDMIISVSGNGSSNRGVYNSFSSSPTMTNVTVSATGTASNQGMRNYASSPTIRHSTIISDDTAVYIADVGTTRILQSSIIGGIYTTTGTVTCVNSDNGVDKELNASCTVIP